MFLLGGSGSWARANRVFNDTIGIRRPDRMAPRSTGRGGYSRMMGRRLLLAFCGGWQCSTFSYYYVHLPVRVSPIQIDASPGKEFRNTSDCQIVKGWENWRPRV